MKNKEKTFDGEIKELTDKFEKGEILGFEFDEMFRKISDKYYPPKLKVEKGTSK